MKPRIAFSGVRNSWLMRERNSLFARFAVSACSRATRRLSSARWRTIAAVSTFATDCRKLTSSLVKLRSAT